MNDLDRKEIQAYDNYIQHEKEQYESYAKKGIIYGSACYTDMVLAIDEVERCMDNNEKFEDYFEHLELMGYDLSVFGDAIVHDEVCNEAYRETKNKYCTCKESKN